MMNLHGILSNPRFLPVDLYSECGLYCNRLDCDLCGFEDIVPPDETVFIHPILAFIIKCYPLLVIKYDLSSPFLSNCNGFVIFIGLVQISAD